MFKNHCYKLLGFTFLALALVGIPLPVLPTTPFLLLSAWFFARSSRKWHAWLVNSKLFGPIIDSWESKRCIPLRTKWVAVASMVLVGGASVLFGIEVMSIRVAAVCLMSVGVAVIFSVKTCDGDCTEGGRV